jgi:cell division protein FtsZ
VNEESREADDIAREEYLRLSQEPRNIKVIGVGGGGCNILRLLAANPTPGVEHLACNTHGRSSDRSLDKFTFLEIGQSVQIPWPSGEFKIESGRLRAECPWFLRELKYHLKGAELVIMTIGMGGVTGTGGSPVIAQVVKEMGIPLLAVVNTPYTFEGSHRSECAAKGIQDLKPHVDNIISVPCDFSLRCMPEDTPLNKAFVQLDEMMVEAIGSLVRLINVPNVVCISAADVMRIMRLPGRSTIAFGLGTDPACPALGAVRKAIGNTVEPVDLAKARGALISFVGGPNTRIDDCAEAVGLIAKSLDPKAAVVYGIHSDVGLGDAVRVTLMATGIVEPPPPSPREPGGWLKKLMGKVKT